MIDLISSNLNIGRLFIGMFIVLIISMPVKAYATQPASLCVKSMILERDPTTEGHLVQVVSIGVLDHDTDNLWSGFQREQGIDFNAEIGFKTLCQLDANKSFYPAAGITINDSGETSKIYGDLRFEMQFASGIFLNVGIGAAIHNGELDTTRRDKKQLGSRLLLHFPIEIGLEMAKRHRLSIFFDHVSNAYLADNNEGLDTLGIRYGYRF